MHPLTKYEYCPLCGSHHFAVSSEKSRKCENCGFELFMNPSSANVALIMNERGELLVERRKREPAKGTLDLPGGFADPGETAEEGVCREVMEETGLTVTSAEYIFSMPNVYRYSGVDIPTLDMFFECMWVKPSDIHTEQFGLRSVRWGLIKFMERLKAEGKM